MNIKNELFRKSIHMCSSLVPLVMYFAYWPVIILLLLAAVIYIICEILRKKGHPVPFLSFITVTAARDHEKNSFVTGPLYLVCGILIVTLIFPLEYATVGVFALAFGDGIASLTGKAFGHIKIPFTKGKTIAGSLGCFAGTFISVLIWTKNPLASLITALGTSLIEMLPLGSYDNVLIPFLSTGLYLLVIPH